MNKDNIITILVAIIASAVVSVAVAAFVVSGAPAEVSTNANIDANIEAYLMNNPTKIREVLEAAAKQEQAEAQKKLAEKYVEKLSDLNDETTAPSVGPKDAEITLVEFFDFNCGYCKRVAPALEQVMKNNSDVKFVFRPVAFLSASSKTAALAALAADAQGKYIEFSHALLTSKSAITDEVVYETVTKVGLNLDATKKLMEDAEVLKKFENISNLSREVQIRGVPTLILNGKPVQGIDAATIQNAIDALK